MLARIQKWGNSQGVRIPQQILKEARLDPGECIEITAKSGAITITAVEQSPRGRYNLAELIAKIPKDYRPEEVEWGPPQGREEW